MPPIKHIHQYQRKNLAIPPKEYIVYACALPNCTHYIPAKLAMGKQSLCNKCGNEFTLDRYAIWQQRVNPYCPSCRGEQANDVRLFEEFIK